MPEGGGGGMLPVVVRDCGRCAFTAQLGMVTSSVAQYGMWASLTVLMNTCGPGAGAVKKEIGKTKALSPATCGANNIWVVDSGLPSADLTSYHMVVTWWHAWRMNEGTNWSPQKRRIRPTWKVWCVPPLYERLKHTPSGTWTLQQVVSVIFFLHCTRNLRPPDRGTLEALHALLLHEHLAVGRDVAAARVHDCERRVGVGCVALVLARLADQPMRRLLGGTV